MKSLKDMTDQVHIPYIYPQHGLIITYCRHVRAPLQEKIAALLNAVGAKQPAAAQSEVYCTYIAL